MKKISGLLLIIGLLIICTSTAFADLLLDRGLPVDHLNNAAGANRSNVAWAFGETWLAGDNFTIGGSGNYKIDTLRIWATRSNSYTYENWASSLSFYFGEEGKTISSYAISAISLVKYAGGATYQGSSGVDIPLYQLDINLNQVISGSSAYQFFLGSTDSNIYAFIHASNAALSGSLQSGSDDHMLYANVDGATVTDIGAWSSGDAGWGWDKGSDANIQVYGTAVPEPATMLLLFFGLIGLAGTGRKFRK